MTHSVPELMMPTMTHFLNDDRRWGSSASARVTLNVGSMHSVEVVSCFSSGVRCDMVHRREEQKQDWAKERKKKLGADVNEILKVISVVEWQSGSLSMLGTLGFIRSYRLAS